MTTKPSTEGALKNELHPHTGQVNGTFTQPVFKALDELYSQLGEIELLSDIGQDERNYPKIEGLFSTINRITNELMHKCCNLEFTIKKHLPKEAMPSQAN